MKMSKKFRAIASAALISAMVMSMSGMSALAATTTVTGEKVPVTKNVEVDKNTFAPVTSYTINVVSGNDTSLTYETGTKENPSNETVVVYPGPVGGLTGVTINSASSAASPSEATSIDDNTSKFVYNTSNLSIDPSKFVNDNIIRPGVYHYVVSELDGDYAGKGMEYDKTKYNVYLFMEYGTEAHTSLTCKYVVASKVGDQNAVKTDLVFNNKYDMHDLLITKKVEGNQGNTKKLFDVNIKVDGTKASEKYVVKYTENGDEKETTLVSGEEKTFRLKDTDAVHIYGLSSDDKVLVDEANDCISDGYSVKYTTNSAATGTVSEINNTNDEKISDVSVIDDGATITITNTKSVTTPTGIVMTFGPYALLLVLAGVFAVMFLRKKREDF